MQLEYMAPEHLKTDEIGGTHGYGAADVDVWASGMLLVVMLLGGFDPSLPALHLTGNIECNSADRRTCNKAARRLPSTVLSAGVLPVTILLGANVGADFECMSASRCAVVGRAALRNRLECRHALLPKQTPWHPLASTEAKFRQ